MAIEDLMMPNLSGNPSNPMMPPVELIKPRPALVLKTKDKTGGKVFINITMHELVKKPVDASMQEISDEHLDSERGISNLRVPLDCSDPVDLEDKSGEKARAIDVMFSPSVVERALQGRFSEYYKMELARLAINAAEGEMKSGLDHKSVKYLKSLYKGDGPKPFPWLGGDPWGPAGQPQGRKQPAKKTKSTGASEGLVGPLAESGDILAAERMDESELKEVSSQRKSGEKAIKKGFLANAGGKLYANEDGSYGSSEQSGPKYDPVEQQLSHLPEGLRKKCAVVDTTKLTQDEVRDAMTQYAETGKVTTGPAAAQIYKKDDPAHKKDFDSLFKKTAEAPEPTFALGFESSSKKKSKIQELEHTIKTVSDTESGISAHNLVVNLPESVQGMKDMEVEISALKVEITTNDGTYGLNLGWPSSIDPDAATAKFKKKSRQLMIVGPVA